MHEKKTQDKETPLWRFDRPLHMTDVKLFTHAFSANVSAESAHLKHDGLIRVVEFLQINRRTCMELHNTSKMDALKRSHSYLHNILICNIFLLVRLQQNQKKLVLFYSTFISRLLQKTTRTHANIICDLSLYYCKEDDDDDDDDGPRFSDSEECVEFRNCPLAPT